MIVIPSIELSLKNRPEFLHKLSVFAHTYGCADRPALIWQCRALETVEFDVGQKPLIEALAGGSGTESEAGWWSAFRSGHPPVFTFDGLGATAVDYGSGWMSEVHSDGHVIAGLWDFPEEKGQKFLFDWHADAFTDFALLARALYNAAGYANSSEFTCTLLAAEQLAFVRSDDRSRRAPRKISRPFLQWRIRKCNSEADLETTAIVMARELPRAFGVAGSRPTARTTYTWLSRSEIPRQPSQ